MRLKQMMAATFCATQFAAGAAIDAVQLWEGGPYFATCNVGGTMPGDYGGLYMFDDDKAKEAAESFGAGWRLPTKAELNALCSACIRSYDVDETGDGSLNGGIRFTGQGAYASKSVFLPLAGGDEGFGRKNDQRRGDYWTSGREDILNAYTLYISRAGDTIGAYVTGLGSRGFRSVRAVRDTPLVLEPVEYLDWDDVGKRMTNAVCTAYEEYTIHTLLKPDTTYVVKGDVTNTTGIRVEGTLANPTRLILCDGAKLTATKGVVVEARGATTNALIICGQTAGTGELKATGGNYGAAGIGGGNSRNGGMVTINGGTVTATGATDAAGIGGGHWAACGTVTINGGTVTATGSTDAAGIGGSKGRIGGPVTFGADFNVVTGKTAAVTAPVAQKDYEKDHSAAYVRITPLVPQPPLPTPEPTPTPAPVPEPVEPMAVDVPVVTPAGAFEVPKATTEGGVLVKDGKAFGVLQVKVGKASKAGESKVSVTVIGLDGKKYTSKAVKVPTGGTSTATFEVKKLGTLTLTIGANGFSGSLNGAVATSVAGTAAVTDGKATFAAGDLSSLAGVLTKYLPADELVTRTEKKWKVAAKAGKLKYVKPNAKKGIAGGLEAKGDNIAALKLTYAPKTQTFKGSFKVWTFDEAKKKLKSVSAKVTGVVVNGAGYGEVVVKKAKIGELTVK